MGNNYDLSTPPDVENRRRYAATKYVLHVLVTALMEHVEDRWTETELDAEVLWSLSSHLRPSESAKRIANLLVDLAEARYE